MFSKWLTWQVAFPGLVCDRQILHEFICKSAYDRSVALATVYAGVVYGVWGIVIDIQYMSFQDGANEGRHDTRSASHVSNAMRRVIRVKCGKS